MSKIVQVHLLVPDDLAKRIDRAARPNGFTRTQYIKNAVLIALSETEEAHRLKRLRGKRVEQSVSVEETTEVSDDNSGLGLESILSSSTVMTEAEADPPAATDPISRLAEAIVAKLSVQKAAPADEKPSAKILFDKLAALLP